MIRALLIAASIAFTACGGEPECPEPPACPEPEPCESTQPLNATGALAAPPETPLGVWLVTWDRSATGWTPEKFTGVLVVGQEQVGLDWRQSTCQPVLHRLMVEGARVELEYSCEGGKSRNTIKAEVEDGGLWGRMKAELPDGKGVPWSPISGVRVGSARALRVEGAPGP